MEDCWPCWEVTVKRASEQRVEFCGGVEASCPQAQLREYWQRPGLLYNLATLKQEGWKVTLEGHLRN